MPVIRIICNVAKKNALFLQADNITNRQLWNWKLMANTPGIRKFSSIELTKNLQLITGEKRDVKVVDFKLTTPQDRPLLILLAWLLAKPQHIKKFANFYLNQGFDVLNVQITPWQLLWPCNGSQVIASDVVKFLDVNRSYAPLTLHGFSVGGYVWGEVLVKIEKEKPRYQHIINRIAGQVWDSTADITELPYGVPHAIFPRNSVLQNSLRTYINYHLKTFDKVATCHYAKSSQAFHNNVVHAPALFFVSKTDHIGTEKANMRARDNWISMGMEVYWKCWDKSPHVGHYRTHSKEYMEELIAFLSSLGLLSTLEQLQAKV